MQRQADKSISWSNSIDVGGLVTDRGCAEGEDETQTETVFHRLSRERSSAVADAAKDQNALPQ
jgi:hypothetical protein